MPRIDRAEQQAEIGRRLTALRNTAGFTQVDAAKHLGVSQSAIAKLEAGIRRLTFLDALDLMDRYGASLMELIPNHTAGEGRRIES
jgi:transcriptional regulator with XRE-family HTH domain